MIWPLEKINERLYIDGEGRTNNNRFARAAAHRDVFFGSGTDCDYTTTH
jgi:hypothetical protein